MKKVLTKKETEFLVKLAELVDNYNAYFSCESSKEINVVVYDDEDTESQNVPIRFQSQFDESEITDLLKSNFRNATSISKELAAGTYQETNFLIEHPDDGEEEGGHGENEILSGSEKVSGDEIDS